MEYASAILQEELLDTQELPELFIDHAVLYHGSDIPGTAAFDLDRVDETTVGRGFYLVSNPDDAAGYARRRYEGRKGPTPVVYEVELENLRFANLDNEEMLDEILTGFVWALVELRDRVVQEQRPGFTFRRESLNRAIEAIEGGSVPPGSVSVAVGPARGRMFSEYMRGLGYDGIKTTEGGEPPHVGTHDTYLVFDPANARIIGEKHLVV